MATTLTATSLHDRVYEELRTRLLTRRHVPGEKLSLHELAAELGVSRSPVHHALTRLVSEGLLSVKARRGYFVTPVTADALAEGYEVRLALELHAADRAVGHVAEEDLRAFRSLLEGTTAAISHQQWDVANAAFHEHQIDLVVVEQVKRLGHVLWRQGGAVAADGDARRARRARRAKHRRGDRPRRHGRGLRQRT